jgi:cold shock protein
LKTTVKSWFADKGYGFLNNGSEGSRDILVHSSQLRNCHYLKPGAVVEFDCDFNDRGLVAKNVVLSLQEQFSNHTKTFQRPQVTRYHGSTNQLPGKPRY